MLHSPARFNQWLPAAFDGVFDWDFLEPAFNPSGIKPTDIDAAIERNGNFLLFETKAKGQPIPIGQCRALTQYWRCGATIFHLEGKSPPTISGISIYEGGQYVQGASIGSLPIRGCDWQYVLWAARRWFCRASSLAPPSREEWDRQLWLMDYDGELRKK